MQQAYRVIRVVAEAQTLRIVLALAPSELMLRELVTACTALKTEHSSGIKALVLDFRAGMDTTRATDETAIPASIAQAWAAVQAVEAPVLAVVRGTLSTVASTLVQSTDLILVAHDAVLPLSPPDNAHSHAHGSASNGNVKALADTNSYTGTEALRLGLVNWSVPASTIDAEMERVLNMLREKSARALRLVKASVHLGTALSSDGQQIPAQVRLKTLEQVHEFYLAEVMQTADASEGLHAFLEKRKPQWKNH